MRKQEKKKSRVESEKDEGEATGVQRGRWGRSRRRKAAGGSWVAACRKQARRRRKRGKRQIEEDRLVEVLHNEIFCRRPR